MPSTHSLIACFVYYYFWVHLIPRWRGYRIRHEKLVLEGGEVTHKLVKVPLEQLELWDQTHDAYGRQIRRGGSSDEDSSRAGTQEKFTQVSEK